MQATTPASLPTTIQFLSDLIATLSSLSQQVELIGTNNNSAASSNNLPHAHKSPASLPDSVRPLLLTLHVLFPHILLDALDLLDRGLVTVFVLAAQDTSHEDPASQIPVEQQQQPQPQPRQDQRAERHHDGASKPRQRKCYYVRSAQPVSTPGRRGHGYTSSYPTSNVSSTASGGANASITTTGTGSSAGGPLYQVHLTAWNCSCAAFAFSSFSHVSYPVHQSSVTSADAPGARHIGGELSDGNDIPLQSPAAAEESIRTTQEDWQDIATRWQGRIFSQTSAHSTTCRTAPQEKVGNPRAEEKFRYGGLGLPSTEGSGAAVPVCKHLLACVLAETCPGLFGGRVGRGLATEDNAGGGNGEGMRGITEKWVGEAELAGWAGGWGFV